MNALVLNLGKNSRMTCPGLKSFKGLLQLGFTRGGDCKSGRSLCVVVCELGRCSLAAAHTGGVFYVAMQHFQG